MANHYNAQITVLPGVKGGIDRDVLVYAKENNIPFIIETDKELLTEAYKDKWEVKIITSNVELRKRHVLDGVDFIQDQKHIEGLLPYLKDAVITIDEQIEAHDGQARYIIVKDGNITFESKGYIYPIMSEVAYKPINYIDR